MNLAGGAFLVFLGSGLGGVARFLVGLAALRLAGAGFPWGTLAINVVGSCLMGIVVGALAFRPEAEWIQPVRLFLTTGILGGFTTFSAFSLETVLLWESGETSAALAYVAASVAVSVAALAVGLLAMRALG